MTTWLRRMDGYLRVELPGLRGLRAAEQSWGKRPPGCWKKNCVPHTHDVLRAVETFARALECVCPAVQRLLRAMKIDLLHEARGELALRARRRRVQSFDDLSSSCARRSRPARPRAGGAPASAPWTAALVDEFAGSDPHSTGSCSASGGAAACRFPGRGPEAGDLRLPRRGRRAYHAARQDAAARHDLIRNWRSEPALLTAVNAVFGGVRQPFVLETPSVFGS